MKKYGRPRTAITKFLYCNSHGETEWVLHGKKTEKWKCTKCMLDYTNTYRLKKKIAAIKYKGGKCELCGYNKYTGALDFHHIDPLLKNFDLGGVGIQKSWDKLKIELDKCQLLCRNCHFEIHNQMDIIRISKNKREPTKYNRKEIHRINCKKLGKKPSL